MYKQAAYCSGEDDAPGVVVGGADPDLLATLCFLSFSVNIDRTEVKFYRTGV
jgi:hypothetical protein